MATKAGKEDLGPLFSAHEAKPFKPFAYHDKHLDCIRVKIQDCSVKEVRMNRWFTLLYANHTSSEQAVGFTIKGVKFLFQTLRLPENATIKLADLIQKIVQAYPADTVIEAVKRIKESSVDLKLKVDMAA